MLFFRLTTFYYQYQYPVKPTLFSFCEIVSCVPLALALEEGSTNQTPVSLLKDLICSASSLVRASIDFCAVLLLT